MDLVIHSPSHRLTVNVLLNNITFLWFLLFSMCHSLHVAVNKCINWCFVHLYLLFYYNNKVFMLMVDYKPSALHGQNILGVTILFFRGHVTSSESDHRTRRQHFPNWWSMMTMNLSCTDTEIRGFEDFGVTSLTFLGSRDVISHVTIWFGICGFLLVVH